MAQLRAVWPQVQQALDAGHTLRLIHKRLNMVGVQISYKRLIVYRGRIERRKKGPAPPAPSFTPSPASSPDSTPPTFDPLVNFRAQEQKRSALEISVRPSRRKQAHLRNRRFNTAMSKSLTPNSLIRNPLIDDEPKNSKSTRSVHLSLQGKGGVGKSLIASFWRSFTKTTAFTRSA